MQTMVGTMKLSAPKTARHPAAQAPPTTALQRCSGSFCHWSRKMTTKSAVITKERPSVSKGTTSPRRPPMVAPDTQ